MRLLRRLGALGVLGLGVFLFCVPLYFSGVVPAERELAAARAALERAKPRPGVQRTALAGPEAELARFQRFFPPEEDLALEVERVYKVARGAGLQLQQGEYRLERSPGLLAYRMALPVRGSYAQVRAFLSAVLTDIPVASVDALRFERKRSADAQLEAHFRITLYLRPAP